MAATTIPPGTPPTSTCPATLGGIAASGRSASLFFAAAALSIVVSAAIVISLFSKGWEFIAQRRLGRRDHGRHVEPPPERLRHPPAAREQPDRHRHRHGRRRARSGWAPRSTSPSSPRPASGAMLKPILEVLAGVPSVVVGFFALGVDRPQRRRAASSARSTAAPAACWPPASASASSPSRSWPRCPRTPCEPSRSALREASAGLGARRMTHDAAGGAAGGGVGPRGRRSSSPCPGPSARRWSCSSPAGAATVGNFSTNPLDSGPDHDGRHGVAGHRHRERARAPASPTRACSWSASSCSSSRSG